MIIDDLAELFENLEQKTLTKKLQDSFVENENL